MILSPISVSVLFLFLLLSFPLFLSVSSYYKKAEVHNTDFNKSLHSVNIVVSSDPVRGCVCVCVA